MLKVEIIHQFHEIMRDLANNEFTVLGFYETRATLVHSETGIKLDIELSDTRVIAKIGRPEIERLDNSFVKNIKNLSKVIGGEAQLYLKETSIKQIENADALYVYSDFLNIREYEELSTTAQELLNIVSVTFSAQFSYKDVKFFEGADIHRLSKKLERSLAARKRAIELHGSSCLVCNFNFQTFYGDLGENFIHIHHLKPISSAGYGEVNPDTDLVPVCPNCHAMLHKQTPPLSPENLKILIEKSSK